MKNIFYSSTGLHRFCPTERLFLFHSVSPKYLFSAYVSVLKGRLFSIIIFVSEMKLYLVVTEHQRYLVSLPWKSNFKRIPVIATDVKLQLVNN